MPFGFLGEHEYRVDDKGRIPLPPSFRERLGREGGVIGPGPDNCIRIYPAVEWEKLKQQLIQLPDKAKVRRLRRFFNSFSFDFTVDRQGRVTIPSTLRLRADIHDEAIVTGVGEYIEVWNPKRWQEQGEIVMENVWQDLESLE